MAAGSPQIPQPLNRLKNFNGSVLLEEEKEEPVEATPQLSEMEKIKQIAKLHSAVDVSTTLDKVALRKEYHEALARNGMSLDVIIKEIKTLCATAKDDTKLRAYEFILKSLGLDKYEASEGGGKNWEELILKIAEKERALPNAQQMKVIEGHVVYPVKAPEIPPEILQKRKEEEELSESIYEQWNSNRDERNGDSGKA